jgi:hypothetical protein
MNKNTQPQDDPNKNNLSSPTPQKSSRKFALGLLAVSLVILLISVSIYFGIQIGKTQGFKPNYKNLSVENLDKVPTPQNNDELKNQVSISTADWVTYTNDKYGFSFKHPKELKIENIGVSPNDQYRLTYMGEFNRPQTEIADGYIFYVNVRGDEPVDVAAINTYEGAKQNCYETSVFPPISNSVIDGRISKTYNVKDCLGDYTENFVSNGNVTLELTQVYTGKEPEYSEYKATTEEILKTFKFTK